MEKEPNDNQEVNTKSWLTRDLQEMLLAFNAVRESVLHNGNFFNFLGEQKSLSHINRLRPLLISSLFQLGAWWQSHSLG